VYSRKLVFRQLVLSEVGLVGAACTLYVILRCRVSGGESIQPRIRPFDDRDAEAVVDLSLRAWAPVFVSLEQALGSEIFRRQHPNWREDQRREVENVCAAKKGRVWIAEVGASVVGFVAVELHHPERSMGEISMLAVDPDYQGGGIGTALTEFALDRLKDAGMTVATVETGGDPGHAAARRTYEKAGYVQLPIARYFKNL
jgi:ribosomal protein S18 acetylase RimI-like enzyme